MRLEIAAVVVTYNSAAVIDNCLQSLENVAEIVVVDNGSADDTVRIVQRSRSGVRLIANPENRGFAAAANQGVRATVSPVVLFVNPDVTMVTGLGAAAEELRKPGVGAAAGRLTDENGQTQVGFTLRRFPTPACFVLEALLVNRVWPRNPVNRRYRCLDLDYGRSQDVDQPAGAFLLVRRDLLEQAGMLDERFFPLWFEDVDLCWRIRQGGHRIRYVPECVARHRGGHSVARISLERQQVYWYGSLLTYAQKHFSPSARVAIRASILAGAAVRLFVSLGRGQTWQVYGRVMGLALGRRTEKAGQVQPHVLT